MTEIQANDDATKMLLAGRTLAAKRWPYLATALFAMKPVRIDDAKVLDTCAVDERWRLYWNAQFFASLNIDEAAGAWIHEVGHLLRDHRNRFKALQEPDTRHAVWNKSGDACINVDAIESGAIIPEVKGFLPERIPGARRDMATETIYRLMLDSDEGQKLLPKEPPLVIKPAKVPHSYTTPLSVMCVTNKPVIAKTGMEISVGADINVDASDMVYYSNRSMVFTIHEVLDAGEYQIQLTNTATNDVVEAKFTVVAPQISLRPDHISRGYETPRKFVVKGGLTEFVDGDTVELVDGDGNVVPDAIGDITVIDKETIKVHLMKEVDEAIYQVVATNKGEKISKALPIGVPFIEINPSQANEGYTAPLKIAAMADDFVLDNNTNMQVVQLDPMDGAIPVPNALSSLNVLSAKNGEFDITISLPVGEYGIVFASKGDQAYATFSVVPPEWDISEGEGEGQGNGEGEGEGQGNGEGEGEGEGQGNGEGHSDCGSGSGGGKRPWEKGEGDENDGSISPSQGNLVRQQTAKEVLEHSKARGSMPGGYLRWAEEVLDPKVDWRSELASVIRRTTALVAGMRTHTYSRINQRRGQASRNVIFPALRQPPPPTVDVIVDTSGSMSDKMLSRCLGEIEGIIRNSSRGGRGSLRVRSCDMESSEPSTIRKIQDMKLSGGGGTDMRIGIEAAAKMKPKADVIITMTDGETPWPEEAPAENPRAKYICLLVAGNPHYSKPPEWMHVITLDEDK